MVVAAAVLDVGADEVAPVADVVAVTAGSAAGAVETSGMLRKMDESKFLLLGMLLLWQRNSARSFIVMPFRPPGKSRSRCPIWGSIC